MSKLADIGQAQHQPVSIEVMEVAEDEIARLRTITLNLAEEVQTLQKALVGNQKEYAQHLTQLTEQNENQAQTIRVQQETIERCMTEAGDLLARLKDGMTAHVWILRGEINVSRRQLAHLLGDAYQGLFTRLEENTPQNPPICPVEPPLPDETANVPDVPVPVHTSPQVRLAGGK